MADEDGIVYADTSALVKLVVHEAETDVLTEQVSGWERVASSEIGAIELPRAVARARHDGRADVADDRTVREVLAAVELMSLSDDRLQSAAESAGARTARPV